MRTLTASRAEAADRALTFQTHPSGSAPFYSVYPCADGQWVQLGCVHIGFITIAANLLGIGDLVKAERFGGGAACKTPADDAELRARVSSVLTKLKANPAMRIARIADRASIATMGGNPQATFYVDFEGNAYSAAFQGATGVLTGPSKSKGMHG